MIIIGLTGILGSGKSTVAASLRKRGLDVIDLDALARDSLNWKETQDDIKVAFGQEYVVNGAVDVEKLGRVVFTKENLRVLEAIIHPRMTDEIRRRLSAFEKEGVCVAFIDHPLFFETGFYRKFDKIVVVSAPMETIKERLKKRGMAPDDIERRLSFQISLDRKEKMADYVVNNSGTEDQLEEQIDMLLERITETGGSRRCI